MTTVVPAAGKPDDARPGVPMRRVAAAGVAGVLAVALLPGQALAQQGECVEPSQARIAEVSWPQELLGYDRAWNLTRGGGTVVAVVDTGVDASVPQLRGRVSAGPNVLADGERTDTDCAGHGTFMAGIVAATASTGAGFAGVAPDARVVAVRYRDGRQNGDTASAGAAIRAAVDAGAGIVVLGEPLSHGDGGARDAVRYAGERNALVVTPGFTLPRDLPRPDRVPDNLISVAGVTPGQAGARPPVGPLELLAPGEQVTSLSRVTGGQVIGSGTEMAAAFVAGTAALVRSYRPDLSAPEVKQRMLDTSLPPAQAIAGERARIVDPLGAVATVLPVRDVAVAPDTRPIAVDLSQPVDGPRIRASLFVAAALAVTIGAVLTVATLRARRRRRRAATA